ncbi:MAG TPA: adenylate kinase [Thermoanaerobaculaceae bacterium]|nr:adenylate kinase [Thermoanaerobaculaceae bacterium]
MVTRALDVVLLGPPGAGKGTQAKRIAAAFELLHVSTGDLLRDEVAKGSTLGQEAKEYMNRGELVPDAVVGKMLSKLLHSRRGALGCVYDGYPRTTAQEELLEDLLAELNRRVDVALYLAVPDRELLARITGRRSCPSCGAVYHVATQPPKREGICDACGTGLVQRDDDKAPVVRERLKVYRKHTAPLLKLYEGRGILRGVDGEVNPDEVFKRLREAMGSIGK